MATASGVPEDELQKILTSIEEIIWSKQTYTVQDIYARCVFPVFAKVEDSFYGDQFTESYCTGEILWISGGIEQKRVIMESHKGECLSIPISNNFKIKRSNSEYEKYQPLTDILVESEMGEWIEISDTTLYNYKNDDIWNKFTRYDFRSMKISGKHSMTFLTGFLLFKEMSILDCSPSVIRHHPQQTFVLGTGLKTHTSVKWTQFFHDEPILPGIILYSKEYNNRKSQSMQLMSSEEIEARNGKEGSNGSKDQEDMQSYDKINTHPENLTSKSRGGKKRKYKKNIRKLLKQPSHGTLEKAINKCYKQIPPVIEQWEKNEENKYEKLILSNKDQAHNYFEIVQCVPENNLPLTPDKTQEQHTDKCYSHSELISSAIYPSVSSIHNQPNLSKTPISTPNCYERELPMIPPSNVVVSSSNSYYEIPLSISYNEIPVPMLECKCDKIDTSTTHEFEKLKIKDGPIRQNDDLPQDLRMLTLDQVKDCLHLLHLERLVDKFKENDIDGIILCELSKDILTNDLGLTNIEAIKLSKFIDQKWLPNSS
ncbi:uncharacterized protein LOC117101264 [Anneissia japonica]|uniref:uncharacterized protein LOC117101264 n=1 Tax=Anneissia japonica TaxID=1529436 RepID=UPI001425662C|nr:uncharacterized protein LOC117101264 [Anneissia japonica]